MQSSTYTPKPFLCLLDSGATGCWLSRSKLPPHIRTYHMAPITNQTLAGTFTANEEVELYNILLPEFHKTRRIQTLTAKIFDHGCRYDMILRRNLMNDLGIVLDFNNKSMAWDGSTVAMREYDQTQEQTSLATNLLLNVVHSNLEANDSITLLNQHSDMNYQEKDVDPSGYKTKTIHTSLYEPSNLQDIVDKCVYMLPSKREQLYSLLNQFHNLIDGRLKTFKGPPVHLELIENPVPVRRRPYTILTSLLAVFKEELRPLISIAVIEKAQRSEWIAGTFIFPKKDGCIWWITDFRGLNKTLRQKVYPLRNISEIFQRSSGYQYFTKLDISMQNYTFVFDEASHNLCAFATPIGLYRYCRLPMGVSESPDIAMEKMHSILDDIEGIEFYMDDVGVFSSTWPAHLSLLSTVLGRLKSGFTYNPLKCEWAVQETDFLGHWLTPKAIKPWHKKVEAILHLRPPTNVKQLCSSLGMVNYYRDMWPRRTHVLAPLTALMGKCSFLWTPECQRAFDQMKALVSSDALLVFPDHTQPFDVETDASVYQLGSVIKQHGRPVSYYSRKLNSAQRNYTTIGNELLSIVETYKEFRSILFGPTNHVHTDHKNLTHRLTDFTTQRILHWRLLLEELNPAFLYKAGPDNVLADALSRVPPAHTEWESTTTSAQLVDCLSCYTFQVEFPTDQMVVANCRSDCPPNQVASQEAIGQTSPG